MWEYLAQNMKADENILVPINLRIYGTSAITQRSLYRDLFNQNGMDFVTEISFCKTPVADIWKNVDFISNRNTRISRTDGGWKSAREIIKVSVLKLRRRTHKFFRGYVIFSSGHKRCPLSNTIIKQHAISFCSLSMLMHDYSFSI